jgi:thioredoxin-dependent peroxiredoxin
VKLSPYHNSSSPSTLLPTMVELRKRPARDPAPTAPPAKRSSSKSNQPSKVKQVVNKAKAAVTGKDPAATDVPPTSDTTVPSEPLVASQTATLPETTTTAGETSSAAPAPATATPASGTKLSASSVNTTIEPLDTFGGSVTTHDGRDVTLAQLLKEVAESPGGKGQGLVIFTYPKASTPGCTTQACLFRDNFGAITEKGYAIYGLSTDSPKSNSNFVAKQGLGYPLLVS